MSFWPIFWPKKKLSLIILGPNIMLSSLRCDKASMRLLIASFLFLLCVASATSTNGFFLRGGGGSSSSGATTTSPRRQQLTTINESYMTTKTAVVIGGGGGGGDDEIIDYYYDTTTSGGRYHQRMRRDQDVEEILNDMSTKTPSEWSGLEWFVMILFLSFLGWVACCLCTLCCCGGGGGGCLSDIMGWLCCWEICCRGGRDIEDCCYDINRC